jgi:hypothetical protein
MVAHCFESDPCELLARVRCAYPGQRLELAKGAQGNFRMARQSTGIVRRRTQLRDVRLRDIIWVG